VIRHHLESYQASGYDSVLTPVDSVSDAGIWSSHADGDKYSDMKVLLGKEVYHSNLTQTESERIQYVIKSLVGQNGQDCKSMSDCVDPDIVKCLDGWHDAGWDKAGCGVSPILGSRDPCLSRDTDFLHQSGGKLICCPAATVPQTCTCAYAIFQWQNVADRLQGCGSVAERNGQCHVGEATLFKSSW